jgi:hypothetical protein
MKVFKKSYGNAQSFLLENIPIRVSKCHKDSFMNIRIATSRIDHRGKRNPGSNAKRCYIIPRFTRLIQCLIFINQAVLVHLDIKRQHLKDGIFSDHPLVDWIFKETFNPGEGLCPIMGTYEKTDPKEVHFGGCQEILIRYISGEIPIDKEILASHDLIQLYYKKFLPQFLIF